MILINLGRTVKIFELIACSAQNFAMDISDVHPLDMVKCFVTHVHRWPAGIMQADSCCFPVERVRLWLLQMILTQSPRNLQVHTTENSCQVQFIFWLINVFSCHLFGQRPYLSLTCVFCNYFHLYCRCEESHVSGVCTIGCGGHTAVFQRDSGKKTSRTADLSAQPNSTPAASGWHTAL